MFDEKKTLLDECGIFFIEVLAFIMGTVNGVF